MPVFQAFINPLGFPEIDLDSSKSATPSAEQLLDYLLCPQLDRGRDTLVERYREINDVSASLPIVPAEENILQKLIWPLRNAKSSYMLGNYLGCIALCGMVGEMVAILLWDISKLALQGKLLEKTMQEALLGSSFEKLGQERRTQVLRVLGLIGDEDVSAFDGLRLIRRRYLHFFSQPHRDVTTDAKEAFKSAVKVVTTVLGLSLGSDGVSIRPDLMGYLKERSVIGPEG
jgi:hypothetical protein